MTINAPRASFAPRYEDADALEALFIQSKGTRVDVPRQRSRLALRCSRSRKEHRTAQNNKRGPQVGAKVSCDDPSGGQPNDGQQRCRNGIGGEC